MGCVCCSLSSFVSLVLDAFERISLCTVCCMLVCCLLFTIMTMLVIGIGIGFHYCTVQTAVAAMDAAAQAAGAVRAGETPSANRRSGMPPGSGSGIGDGSSGRGTANMSPSMRSLNRAAKRAFANAPRERRDSDHPMPSNNNTLNDLLIGNSTFLSVLAKNNTFNGTVLNV